MDSDQDREKSPEREVMTRRARRAILSGRARVHALVRGAVARAIVGDVEKDAPSILPGSFQATRARRCARLAASPAESVVP